MFVASRVCAEGATNTLEDRTGERKRGVMVGGSIRGSSGEASRMGGGDLRRDNCLSLANTQSLNMNRRANSLCRVWSSSPSLACSIATGYTAMDGVLESVVVVGGCVFGSCR